jgi:hypothetical protein
MALGLGYGTPRRMLQSMTSREYAELLCLQKHELIGYDRTDVSLAKVAQAFAGGKLIDHMPPRLEPETEQTFEDMLEAMSLLPNGNNITPEHPG